MMKRRTATIERYHVWGTPHYCLGLFYRGEELTPKVSPGSLLAEWIPADDAGRERLRTLAKAQGFTHVRFTGDWSWPFPPRGGKL